MRTTRSATACILPNPEEYLSRLLLLHVLVTLARASEVDRLRRFAADAVRVGGGLVISGEAGIGKSSLWKLARTECCAAGATVLSARAVEEELGAELTGLHDLLDSLPEAHGVLTPDLSPFDRGRRLLEALTALADAHPVVVAVDDVQWLDSVSAKALRYALRRLEGRPVSVLLTARTTSRYAPTTAELLMPHERVEHLALLPMSAEDLRTVLRPRVGPLTVPELQRVHEASNGNPFAALELARQLRAGGQQGEGTPGIRTVDDSLERRLDACDVSTRDLLEVAALGGTVSVGVLEAAVGGGFDAALTTAIATGWLCRSPDLVLRFAHPLLRGAVDAGMTPVRRRQVHARLADVAPDPDTRARHLALSAVAADPHVAAELEAAASRAARQGASTAAATLMGHSMRLTPVADSEALGRRCLAEVTLCAASGEPARAVAMADRLIAAMPPGPQRTAVILLRSFLDLDHAEETLHALLDHETDPLTRGNVNEMLAVVLGLYRGDLGWARLYAEGALGVAREHGDEDLTVRAATVLSAVSLLAGKPRHELVVEAEALAGSRGGPPLGRWPKIFRARHDLWAGRLEQAEAAFRRIHEVFCASGTEFQRPYRLADLATVAVARGNLVRAQELVAEGLEAAEDAGNEHARVWLHWVGGTGHALCGDADAARQAADFLEDWGSRHREPARVVMAYDIRGLLALGAGDASTAAEHLTEGARRLRALGHRHPGWLPVLPHAIEATAAAGQVEQCRLLATELADQAAALRLPWVDAVALGARGLVELLDGDPTEAAAVLHAAATRLAGLGYVLDAARQSLARGRALIRAGQRSAARTCLESARGAFVTAGALPWAGHVDAELPRARGPATSGEDVVTLTPTERRIAGLVLAGHRNREIGCELFISESTVEAHLTRMYRKLGIRSRGALARAIPPAALALQP